ncbi:MAG TPA: aldehyde dehydrogenase family protein [Actinomycetota bacterium]|nr:aldehyde dehydrogenase family protein [Actinomycetota bacterium]
MAIPGIDRAEAAADAEAAFRPQVVGNEAAGTVDRLRATYESGRTRPEAWRRVQLQAIKRMLVEHEDEFLEALAHDLGKPSVEGWLTDVVLTIRDVDYTLKHMGDWMRPERVSVPVVQQPASARVVREPLGVVLVIAPWNYPIQLLLEPMIAALAAGNAVVGKPSEISEATSEVLGRLVPQYLDPDAVAIVEGGVDETTALLEQRFDHILYTGNGRVGRIVARAAAEHLTPVTLELGGKSPAIVHADADIEVAARRIAFGKWINAGQTCIAPDYVLVHRDVERALVEGLRGQIARFFGDDPRTSPDYARIVNQSHFERLASLLDQGGFTEVVAGGGVDPNDRYIAPTVLRGVDPSAAVMQDEIFGPILPVIAVDSLDAAIRFVNERPKPLSLYVFAKSRQAQQAVLQRTSSGGACVNATVVHFAVPGLPFGGVGDSGYGAYHGREGFETFSNRKPVMSKPVKPDPPVQYPPWTGLKRKVLRKIL